MLPIQLQLTYRRPAIGMHVLQRTAIASATIEMRRTSRAAAVRNRMPDARVEQLCGGLGGRILLPPHLRRTLRRLVDAQRGGALLQAERFEGPASG